MPSGERITNASRSAKRVVTSRRKPGSVSVPRPGSSLSGGPFAIERTLGKRQLQFGDTVNQHNSLLIGHPHLDRDERHTKRGLGFPGGDLPVDVSDIALE